ncbi:unnamed protein product [Cuscuta campestris]|uniref:Uncharacterized protein n=1 Tax=Cuscuta campestris TaxID=132261 RepID=A0A484MYT0_9ASTE|nr:unnamed protein product [Cuscuta campestris]
MDDEGMFPEVSGGLGCKGPEFSEGGWVVDGVSNVEMLIFVFFLLEGVSHRFPYAWRSLYNLANRLEPHKNIPTILVGLHLE